MISYSVPMRILDAFAAAFINTFGITQPTEATRRRASWFIFFITLLTLVIVFAIGYGFYSAMRR